MRKLASLFIAYLGVYLSHIASSFINNKGVFSYERFLYATHCFICANNLIFLSILTIMLLTLNKKFNLLKVSFSGVWFFQVVLFYLSQAMLLTGGESNHFSLNFLLVAIITQLPIALIIKVILYAVDKIISKFTKLIKSKQLDLCKNLYTKPLIYNYILAFIASTLRSPPLIASN